jgi:hypothetical protein
MSTIEKIAMGIVGVAMVTTVILPGRQTPAVLQAFGSVFSGSLKTAMGR